MRIIHKVSRAAEGGDVTDVVVYDFPEGAKQYWQLIHDAIMDYCTTPEGRQRAANGQMITYADFLDFVPDEICNRHGFTRTLASQTAEHHEGQERVMYEYGIQHYLRKIDRMQEREQAIYRIIPQLAKAMADMQSQVPKTDKWSYWRIADTAIRWSIEFVDSNELEDLRGFVRRKLDAQTAPKIKA